MRRRWSRQSSMVHFTEKKTGTPAAPLEHEQKRPRRVVPSRHSPRARRRARPLPPLPQPPPHAPRRLPHRTTELPGAAPSPSLPRPLLSPLPSRRNRRRPSCCCSARSSSAPSSVGQSGTAPSSAAQSSAHQPNAGQSSAFHSSAGSSIPPSRGFTCSETSDLFESPRLDRGGTSSDASRASGDASSSSKASRRIRRH